MELVSDRHLTCRVSYMRHTEFAPSQGNEFGIAPMTLIRSMYQMFRHGSSFDFSLMQILSLWDVR